MRYLPLCLMILVFTATPAFPDEKNDVLAVERELKKRETAADIIRRTYKRAQKAVDSSSIEKTRKEVWAEIKEMNKKTSWESEKCSFYGDKFFSYVQKDLWHKTLNRKWTNTCNKHLDLVEEEGKLHDRHIDLLNQIDEMRAIMTFKFLDDEIKELRKRGKHAVIHELQEWLNKAKARFRKLKKERADKKSASIQD